MRKLVALTIAGAACAALALPAFGATKTVRVGDDFFSPRTATIKKNDTVRFRWVGENLHNVRVTSGPSRFNSGTPKRSGTYARKLTRKGTYRIICDVHPDNMKGTIRVR